MRCAAVPCACPPGCDFHRGCPAEPRPGQNWGLLLFDERRLLYNEAWEGAYGLQQAVNVICHEVAHQW